MLSRSCVNLLDLASSDVMSYPPTPKPLPRVMTDAGFIADADGNADESNASTSGYWERKIIVANFLPIQAHKDAQSGDWSFSYDDDSLLVQMKDGFSSGSEVIYVGSLKAEVDQSEQEEVSSKLLEEFKCVPTFLPPDIYKNFYHGFCKHHLWPLFHYMLPMHPSHENRFDRSLWQSYVSANKIFADKIMEVINPEYDYVWIHDYHLMVLPTFLRRRFYRIKLGFSLHSPFPSSEIYRTLPVREEILRALLNADLIGFHTFDYARHFLTCCSRLLGIDYESKRGHICLDYFGRTVYVKILPVGVHLGRLESALNHESTARKLREIEEEFKDKKVIIGVDDMDIFKGISLKLLAMEHLLQRYDNMRGKVVLVQITNPARSSGNDIQEATRETYAAVERINNAFGYPGYVPVVLLDRPVPFYEKTAYYSLAECCIVNAVRDGMNLVPYKYTVCREGTDKTNASKCPRTSTLVLSEFIGCSPSLSGAIRVNPWDVEAVADALNTAISMPEMEKQLRHEKHYKYITTHDISYWARSFMQDLVHACKEHYSNRCWGIGFGLSFRILSLSPNFRRLTADNVVTAYKRTKRRAIFLDYDGTVVPQSSIVKRPTADVVAVLNGLCDDPKNVVFIVSGRGKVSLADWLTPVGNIGIAAEHGYLMRGKGESEWEVRKVAGDFEWKRMAEPVMELYREATDGSWIETKESALVWHHQDADPDFGSCQAKELLDHLENVLANEPVVVSRGQHIVEVKPQGVTKGLVAESVLSAMMARGEAPDLVMCIGDDRSDEDMFASITSASLPTQAEVFACTVGQKPSKARYYLDDTTDVLALLRGLVAPSGMRSKFKNGELQVSFEKSGVI